MLLDPDDLRDPVGRVCEAVAALVGIFLIAIGLDLAVQLAEIWLSWAAGEDHPGGLYRARGAAAELS
ncbi:hypothetical protein [Hansschlegelia beijingensis]|uniref:Uncharacterized protein n=1 Tax=Hansschlegelia beijingensis TaxID=1133344 RepID=A0A7W6CYP8_9HYPH|nr:hypothetical protein [Hansschlegelia beijingensis]MBB3972699.1 hypothetical protein [Hansschlegelia beijingensis]